MPGEHASVMLDAVFEGGGVKGIGLVGAAARLEEAGYRFEHLAGTSAGAIVAALLAAGYTAAELHQIIGRLDYTRFEDPSLVKRLPLVGSLLSVLTSKGLYKGDYFQRWLAELLAAKGVRTFADLRLPAFARWPGYEYRLRVVASDLTRGRLLVLPQDATDYGLDPDKIPVALAVRMSMSIPFFYRPVAWASRRGSYVSYIVDGGVLSNFPVWLFDGDIHSPTVGFKLVDPEEGEVRVISGPVSLLGALFSTMLEAHDARYIEDADFARTVPVPTLGVRTTDFGLTPEEGEALYQAGYGAAGKFLGTHADALNPSLN